jgi:hypothetical protein
MYQGASEGFAGSLMGGGERVTLRHLDRENPVFEFCLPKEPPELSLDVGSGAVELEPVLQTVVIDKNENLLIMLWRGSLHYGGKGELGRNRIVSSVH